jgi:two-component system, OmpR family, sensor histidine kinase VicK
MERCVCCLAKRVKKNTNHGIQIITGAENITNFTLQGYLRTKEKLDSCLDFVGPSVVATDQRIMRAATEMKARGIKIRLITDVTGENIGFCKVLNSVSEIRHVEGVKGNFGIIDEKEYLIHIIHQKSQAPSQIIYTDDKGSAEAQQFLFNTLWNKAIPFEDRRREIEEGVSPDFIETMRDPVETIRIGLGIVSSATEEILILFPTVNEFYRFEREGLILLLREAAERGVQIRVLTPMDDRITEIAHALNKMSNRFEVRPIVIQQTTRSTIITSDGKFSLVIDLKDDNNYNFVQAIVLAAYSNSATSVWTHTSIFENLWAQSELVA